MSNLFVKKPIEQLMVEATSDSKLKRVLGPVGLTTLGIGCIIGAGIFVITGQAAAQYAGPAIILSFIISGIACAFAGLCYAEFASMIPIAGSAYTYSYATLGEFLAWIIGWDLMLEYLFAAATVSVGWSGYVVSFLDDFGLHIPPQLTYAFGEKMVQVPDQGWVLHSEHLATTLADKGLNINNLPEITCLFNLPAVLIIGLISILLIVGIKEGANFNNVMVIIKITIIIIFICVGFAMLNSDNWSPFIPENTGEWGHYGISGILRGAGVIFFAYIGFDAVSTAAQEARNPQKDMPIGILGSLSVATVLYILVALALTGIVSYTALNVPDPVAEGVNALGPDFFWLRPIVKIAAIAGLSSVILVLLMGQPRIFYTMAKDGLLPEIFTKVHPKYSTPYLSTIITAVAAMVLGAFLPISILGEMVSIGTLLAFVIVCASVILLRKKRPDIHRPFKTPWVPFVPIMGAAICILQMVSLPWQTWIRLIAWMGLGFAVYFLYSRHHSKLQKKSE